jgi:hypothetical protein
MKKLLELLNRYADENGVEKLGNLLEKNGYNKDYYIYLLNLSEDTHFFEHKKSLIDLLESNLEELPF